MKKCTKCHQEKDFSEFPKRKDSPDGYRTNCKSCKNSASRSWRHKNREACNKKQREIYYQTYKSKHHDQILENGRKSDRKRREAKTEYAKQWRKNNPDKIQAINLRQRERQYTWRRSHPEVFAAHTAKRRAGIGQATPSWVDDEHLEKIEAFYRTARTMSEFHEVQFDVDHIEPLNGATTCGLHVHWNLQILTHKENLTKSNKLNQP